MPWYDIWHDMWLIVKSGHVANAKSEDFGNNYKALETANENEPLTGKTAGEDADDRKEEESQDGGDTAKS